MRKLAIVSLLALAAVYAAEHPRPPWERNSLAIGRALYRENCVVCHEIDEASSKKFGPNFYQLFKKEKMPIASVKPNRDYIKLRVKFGGSLMPAFQQRLTEKQIDLLIDYMASR